MEMGRDEMNGLLTTREAAEILRIHIITVYGYIRDGKLRAYRVAGNRWRIKADDLEAFINRDGVGRTYGNASKMQCATDSSPNPSLEEKEEGKESEGSKIHRKTKRT